MYKHQQRSEIVKKIKTLQDVGMAHQKDANKLGMIQKCR